MTYQGAPTSPRASEEKDLQTSPGRSSASSRLLSNRRAVQLALGVELKTLLPLG